MLDPKIAKGHAVPHGLAGAAQLRGTVGPSCRESQQSSRVGALVNAVQLLCAIDPTQRGEKLVGKSVRSLRNQTTRGIKREFEERRKTKRGKKSA